MTGPFSHPLRTLPVRSVWLVGLGGMVALLSLAFWLRWQYATQVHLHVDEFTTLWAARQVQEHGAPIMPSGVLYTRGLLSSYLVALVQQFAGEAPLVGRALSICFGVASVLTIFLVGRREWNVRVGWVAAIGLTLLPEVVVWSSRARFYSPLVFFALLLMWVTFALTRPPRPAANGAPPAQWRLHLLFVGVFALALFSQEQTILLYPPILLALLAWRGWRYFLQPVALFTQASVLALMALRFVIEQVGQPGYFGEMQTHKAYLHLFDDIAGAWDFYGRLLLDMRRLPWSVLAAVAGAAALVALWRMARAGRDVGDERRLLARLPAFHQATLFFGLQFLFVLALFFTVIGNNYRDSRYLLLVEPCWMLLGGAGLVWLVDRIFRATWLRWLVTGIGVLLLAWWIWPLTANALTQEAEGYQPALAYVAAQRQPGDVIMSPQPPACAWGMGEPCDYYLTQRNWYTYVTPRDGVLVDRWSGAELLNTTAQFAAVVKDAPRVWIITDSERLGRRFEDDFLRVIVEQFRKVYDADGVAVLVAEGWQALPTVRAARQYESPIVMGPLALAGWERGEFTAEGRLPMTLLWQKVGAIDDQINTSVQVFAADGTAITQADGPPARGMTATFDFDRVVLPDPKRPLLPADLAPGRYRIDVVAYRVTDGALLSEPVAVEWFLIGPPPAPLATTIDVAWQDGMTLAGHDGMPATFDPGATLNLRLAWRADATPTADYTVFVHLLDEDGQIVAQHDRAPESGFYPTSQWDVGETVADIYALTLPETLATGNYRLMVGLYDPATGQRLLTADGQDAVELAALPAP
jgi:4-amino-4-deoxy-L-arabinose transferase-like glycosyltransferase